MITDERSSTLICIVQVCETIKVVCHPSIHSVFVTNRFHVPCICVYFRTGEIFNCIILNMHKRNHLIEVILHLVLLTVRVKSTGWHFN